MTQAVDQGPRAEVPTGTQYLLGSTYAAALELDPDDDPEAIVFRMRIALRIVDRIETTCGWTDAVREGFRAEREVAEALDYLQRVGHGWVAR